MADLRSPRDLLEETRRSSPGLPRKTSVTAATNTFLEDRRPSTIPEEPEKPTRKQWAIFVLSMLANMFTAMIYSLQAPFYPQEADRKGLQPAQYGFVFGVYELVVFISSPIFGRYMEKIGPRFAMVAGLFIAATACVLFGFLIYFDDSLYFLVFSFVIRIVQGIGQSAYFVAVSTIVASHFPNSVAFTISALETCYGLGLIIGPAIGGVLYQVGGFLLPFVVVGGILLISGILTMWIPYEGSNSESGEGISPLPMLKLPGVWLGAFAVFTTSTSSGYLQATLEPHLHPFNLKPIYLGLMFVISGGVYAVVAPGWGYIVDKGFQPRYCMLIGACFKMVGFSIVGPLPFLPPSIEPKLWLICTGLALSGVGSGGQLIPGFSETLRVSFKKGLPNNPATYGMATGLWQSAYSIGAFIGPSLGGIILQVAGFRIGTLLPIVCNITLVSLLIISFIGEACAKKEKDEDRLPLPGEMEEADVLPRVRPVSGVKPVAGVAIATQTDPIEYMEEPIIRPPLLYEAASSAVSSWMGTPQIYPRGTPYPPQARFRSITRTDSAPKLNLVPRVRLESTSRNRAATTGMW